MKIICCIGYLSKWKYVLIKILWMKIKLFWQSSLHNWNSYCCYYCNPSKSGVGWGSKYKDAVFPAEELNVCTLLRLLSKSCFRFRHRCAACLFCSRRRFCRSRSTPCERKRKRYIYNCFNSEAVTFWCDVVSHFKLWSKQFLNYSSPLRTETTLTLCDALRLGWNI